MNIEKRLKEIAARMAAINTELDTASGEALTALENEVNTLTEERTGLLAELERRKQLRQKVASGVVGTPMQPQNQEPTEAERTANRLVETRTMTVGAEQTRSVLVSGGTLATPTQVSGINDNPEAKYSSIIDFAKVVNCLGMSCNRVAYVDTDAAEAATQTEGSPAIAKEPVFGYVDITPASVAVTAQISKQAKKQTPLNYAANVQSQAYIALRKKAAALATAALKASALNSTVAATLTGTSTKSGAIDEKTLRNLVLNYGGDDGINSGVLFLNKKDLLAFGDVRGTNEKKAVYEITPDTSNPNTGIIKDGGLSVRYCLNSNLTACSGTEQSSTGATVTMLYGDPKCLEIDLFSDYEIRVSEDFTFTSLMDTILGDVEIGADVVVKHGFAALTIAKS
nr:MAG TPA: major capsid protein [Caudoviricetes sp.]